jgi:1,4-alpha-glucan branching enzyme
MTTAAQNPSAPKVTAPLAPPSGSLAETAESASAKTAEPDAVTLVVPQAEGDDVTLVVAATSAPAKAKAAKKPAAATTAKSVSAPAPAPAAEVATPPVAPAPVAKATATPVAPEIDLSAYYSIPEGTAWNPHSVLGGHPFKASDGSDWAVIRAFRPLADAVVITTPAGEYVAPHKAAGVFEVVVPAPGGIVPDYRVTTTYGSDEQTTSDPYRYLPSLGEVDTHLIHEGRHEELWEALGANYHKYHDALGDVEGTAFAVWAPNAQAVRVVGSFNRWTPIHLMRSLGESGIWELFIPGVVEGDLYKYEIKGPDGQWRSKADPLAKWAQVPPETASRVFFSKYEWDDQDWMQKRAATNPLDRPVSIYELHLGSWKIGKSYRELAEELPEYLNKLGFTHVEFMPVAEHPYAPSWGYQVTGYYAPTSRFGDPDDFRFLVDKLHQAGIGVIVDWVPAHFPKDEFALARFDGTPLYEHPDPRLGEHPDWGTYVFDFGRTEVRNFLVANATYWYEYFHIDGLRVDAVASMLYRDYSRKDGEWFPNVFGGRENLEAISFLQEANATAYKRTPGVMMIAEESTAFPGVTAPTDQGGLGFGLKWNMGWMNDSLRYMATDPMYRRYHHGELTFSLVYAFSEQYVLPISHDEVVHGKGSLLNKMPGDRWQQFANVRTFLGYMWTHPGKQLLFMGSEFGQDQEWQETFGLNWWLNDSPWHAGLAELVADLNAVYKARPELWERDFTPDGFEWLDVNDGDRNTLAYLRKDKAGNPVAVVVNFAGNPHENYRLPLPKGGVWKEALNTDDAKYGGTGTGNGGAITAENHPWYGREFSADITVPPLATLIFVPETVPAVTAAKK